MTIKIGSFNVLNYGDYEIDLYSASPILVNSYLKAYKEPPVTIRGNGSVIRNLPFPRLFTQEPRNSQILPHDITGFITTYLKLEKNLLLENRMIF